MTKCTCVEVYVSTIAGLSVDVLPKDISIRMCDAVTESPWTSQRDQGAVKHSAPALTLSTPLIIISLRINLARVSLNNPLWWRAKPIIWHFSRRVDWTWGDFRQNLEGNSQEHCKIRKGKGVEGDLAWQPPDACLQICPRVPPRFLSSWVLTLNRLAQTALNFSHCHSNLLRRGLFK